MSLKNFTLLYVEDDIDAQKQMKQLIGEDVKKFYQAYNGEEGFDMYLDKKPDIVLSDINMPILDGLEMTKKIKDINEKQKILIMSAFDDREYLIKAINLNINGFVLKPVNMDNFQDKLNKIVNELKVELEAHYLREKELELSNRLELALMGNNDGIWDRNLLKNTVTFSDRYKKILGYDIDEFEDDYNAWKCRVHPDDIRNTVITISKNIFGQSKYYETIYRIKHKNGNWLWILDRGKTIYDSSEKAIQMVGTITDVTKYKQQELKLHNLAHYDNLTKIPNRFLFNDRLEQAVKKARRHKQNICVCFIDIDDFKPINDTFGHGVGDEVLKYFSSTIKSFLREDDTFARLGGDEFALILENITSQDSISLLLDKILVSVKEPMKIKENLVRVTCSIGVSQYPQDATISKELLELADIALYKTKEFGKNNYTFF